ncbi:MAG: GNAT family N-acetyltransferase [Chloroflexi bacterium]|nr:GNAT family N-acetyltransferase [Chloroflexota bacterium]
MIDDIGPELKILSTPDEMEALEELQLTIWPSDGRDVVPAHILLTAAHNGGWVIGGFVDESLAGFVFGFIGMTSLPGLPEFKHCSHMLGVHPDQRGTGLGFKLKRAQWQLVRNQGIELITWTYDPLLSTNAHLNITKLGAICNTYKREVYGQMRDGLNAGLPSDRFQVNWWVHSERAIMRLSSRPRRRLDLAHYLDGGAETINSTTLNKANQPVPPKEFPSLPREKEELPSMLLVEIPAEFLAIKNSNPDLALEWRNHSRTIFEDLFENGYFVTDFVFLPGVHPRSYYVLSHGESTLGF